MKGFGAFHGPTDIDLADDDLVALVGPTGSGKSTIIDAITFALYGAVARYEDNRLVAPIINQTSNEARVSLDFELGGRVFTAARIVRRTRAGGATTREARLEQSDEILAGDARSMSQNVEALLGLDVEQFNQTVVLPQGKFATFLHDKPGDRQTTLVRLLGMDLYRRIGRAARQRAARARNQIDALRPDLDREAAHLTGERRAALVNRIEELDSALSRFKVHRETIATLEAELHDLAGDIERLDNLIDRMSGVTAPPGLAELAGRINEAIRARNEADNHRKEMSTKRRLASVALENGPDIATVRLGLKAHTELVQRVQEHDAVASRLDEAVQEFESTKRAADRVREKQAELDGGVDEARRAVTAARAARDSAVTIAQVAAWSAAHSRYEAASKEAGATAAAARLAEEAAQPLHKAVRDAEAAAAESSVRVAELRRRAGVLGHVDLLVVGSACPLCWQEVHELPAHDLDTDLRQAEAEHEIVLAARTDAAQSYEEADKARIKRRAQHESAAKTLTGYESDIASIPPSHRLDGLGAEATELAEAVRTAEQATRQAETAASRHGESASNVKVLEAEQAADRNVTRLTESESILRAQLTSLRVTVADLPDEEELRAQLAECRSLQAEMERADSGFNDAEARYERVTADLEAVNHRHARATEHLHAGRDRVAAFGPPAIDTTNLVAAWAVLTDWIHDQVEAATTRRRTAIEQRSARANSRSVAVSALRGLCADAIDGVDPDASVTELGELLTSRRAASTTDLEHFDRRRAALKKLRERISALTEHAQVANHLGRLLRADGFESWLMEAALHQLAERATERLFELSDGQYSLAVDNRDFVVRDHTNADELRSARTLSGGETFLASLSLALAVADATAEMASEDAPRMESVFLDEGFGTLDPHTLDTVATAVEELGATGRFVGIVTHIRELADRMPVRLEVTKAGGAATVERIET
ncbi:MAG: SMC family ATPase [Acidimicrobiia bacterium]|nr:SMC family ATPase [Acidimicrobiia bacterium]